MLKTLLAQVKEFTKSSILTPVFAFCEVIMEMIIPLLMASIINEGVNKGDTHHIYVTGGIMIITAIFSLTFGLLAAKYGAMASMGLGRNLRKAMFEKIQTYSFANIDKFNTSSLVTRLTTDVTNIQNSYQMILRMCVRALSTLIVAMFMSFFISPKLACIYLVAVILLGGCLAFIVRRAMNYFQEAFKKYDDLNESVQENVSAIRVVKAYVRGDYEKKRFKKASQNIYNMLFRAESVVVWNSPLMQFTVYFCILLISWFGAHMVIGSTLDTGDLMAMLTYCMNILMSLMMLSMVFVMVTQSAAAAQRIEEVLEEQPDITSPENAVKTVKDGSVDFNHVTFAYQQRSGKPVLSDIDLHIRSGETIGVMGGTGSSKSSLVSLISRLYDVTAGEVRVGGVDVRKYDVESLRDAVSVVLQNNVLFSGTIYDNLRWGNENATDEQCREACRLACADEFIERFPEKYNTRIERGGTNVSGGQKQRLCIARALLKNPKVLILDDSTSAVDTATDAKIREAMRTHIPGTTKIIIAQRISSIQDADRVLVLDNGRVNAFDTPENLLKTNAIYQEVYNSQAGSGSGDFDEAAMKGGD